MDQDLVEIVTEFSPQVLNNFKKKKKVNLKTKENYKLSLKRNQQPVDLPPPARPPRRLTRRTVALSESNHSSDRSSIPNVDTSRICTCRNGKENKSPCQYCVNKQLISSDDSQDDTDNKKSTVQNLISEDESQHQSDARHSTSTYKTCRTSQQPQEIESSSDDEVAVLQTSLKRLSFLTPDKSGVTDEPVSSCEKVHRWLTKLNISVTSTKDTSPSRRRHISETSSSDDDNAASSTAYPTITTTSQRSLPTDNDSNYGTSRQSSSCVISQQTDVFSVRTPASQPRQDSPNVTLVERRSTQISSQSSDDDGAQAKTTRRESLFSSITGISSQPTSVGTRGSSQYFIEQPPWSKQVEKPKKKSRPKISNSSSELSDIREEHSNYDRKVINETISSEESFHLVYSPTHSNISELSFYEKSLDTRIKTTAKSNKPQTKNKETLPDTLSWPGSSSTKSTLPPYQIPQSSTEGNNSRKPRPSTQSTISSHAPSVASTLPWPGSSSSKSVASSVAHNLPPPTDGRAQSTAPSFASTLPWNSDSDSPQRPEETHHDFLATPDKSEKKSQPTVNSDIFNWPMYTRDEIYKIIEDVGEKTKSPPKKPPSVVSVATTLPWPSDCDAPIAPSRASSSPDAPSLNQFQTSIQTKLSSTIRSSAVFSDSIHGQSYISAVATRNVLISEEESSPNQSPEHPTTTTQVDSTKNVSIIEISDDEDSSDSDEESPQRIFRRKPNRASYVEIVVSDTEYESDDVSSSKTLQKSVIPPSDSDSSGHGRDKSPIRVDSSESESDYEDEPHVRPPSSADSGSPVLHHSKHKRLSEISEEEEEEEPVPKHLDFSDDSSEDDSHKRTPEKRPSEGRRPQRLSKSPVVVVKPVEHSPPRRRFNISSSDESDNDDKLNKFFESARRLRDKNLRRHLDEDDSPSFVVPDNVEDESEGSETSDDEQPSPSFYHKIHNDDRRKESELDKSWLPANIFKKPVFTPPPLKAPPKSQTTGRPAPKPRQLGGAVFSPVLSFLQSLSATNHSRCHPEAVPYLKKFKSTRNELIARLYALFNEEVFENKLDPNMSITWNNRLRSTAGFCYNQKKAQPGADFLRTSRIELSGKILLDAGRLRDTLIHEMCHAATWCISGTLGGHGPIWKRWTYKARRRFPELPEISRCHSYQIETKYTYKCTQCSYSFGRHTKSLDLERKVCGLCRGRFEILVRGGSNSQPSPSKPPNVFALYVKEHYKVVKAGRKSLKHADVMKMLSQKFSEHKLSQKQA